MLEKKDAVLFVIDVQGKLAQLMQDKEILFENIKKMIKTAQILDIPIVWVEQYPEGLGSTIPEIAELLYFVEPIKKTEFSCCKNKGFMKKVKELNKRQLLIAGIEAHICIYQTSVELVESGYEVQVLGDAVSSRTKANKSIGLNRIQTNGGIITSTEMAIFELLKVAGGDKFKEIIKIIK